MKKLALVILLFAGSPSIAAAQTVCVDRADMLDRLAAEYGEQLTEVKMIKDYGLVEVLRSPSKGTWTIILTKPSGISCVLAAGEGLSPTRSESGSREIGL